MALSAAAHHSYDKVAAGAMYDGLRGQTMEPNTTMTAGPNLSPTGTQLTRNKEDRYGK